MLLASSSKSILHVYSLCPIPRDIFKAQNTGFAMIFYITFPLQQGIPTTMPLNLSGH